ncbi:MAG: hypothetical protein KKB31_03120 [Nanoarchaeota archaeon]|nr:hypothetical protein [Nanoarchaeota archaeon]
MTSRHQNNISLVDNHVKGLLQIARDDYEVSVDPNSPTREARLEAAIAMHSLNAGTSSREIMVGRRIDGSSNEAYVLESLWQLHSGELHEFYSGIYNGYWSR